MAKTKNGLRIAHVAPLFASVPPKRYGGTERVLDWLIREQVKAGHDVTLFATGDSITPARLIPVIPKALWYGEEIGIPNVYHTIELDMVGKRAREFGVIHSHFNFIHFQSIHRLETPMVTTLHWRVDIREYQDLFNYFDDAPLVAISHSQKSYIPNANVVDVIYHGLPVEDYDFYPKGRDYIAFLGRFSPEKGLHIAIDVAKKVGMPLKIAASLPTEASDKCYYEDVIRPLIDGDLVEYVGEVDEKGKAELVGNAKVTIIPTNWPEPFGLVTAESLCMGTPVVALAIGCSKEIVENGKVGYAVSKPAGMVEAIKKIDKIDRRDCRRHIEEKFSSRVMAKRYEKVYKKLIKEGV